MNLTKQQVDEAFELYPQAITFDEKEGIKNLLTYEQAEHAARLAAEFYENEILPRFPERKWHDSFLRAAMAGANIALNNKVGIELSTDHDTRVTVRLQEFAGHLKAVMNWEELQIRASSYFNVKDAYLEKMDSSDGKSKSSYEIYDDHTNEHGNPTSSGVYVPIGVLSITKHIWDTAETVENTELLKVENEEVKSLLLSLKQELLTQYLTKVDSYVDKKTEEWMQRFDYPNPKTIGVYDLFSGNLSNVKMNYLRCYCTSTDRMFLLGVPDTINNAKDAAGWLCQYPSQLEGHIVSVNRQGEIYNIELTEEGKRIKEAPDFDPTKTVPMTGDMYFSLLDYEA